MSEETQNIPAWKRLGLNVKAKVAEDPLALASYIPGAAGNKKKAKKSKSETKITLIGDKKVKKPAKRVKLPKDQRPAPPEKDQLVYLRQYRQDRDNWKFSKQKQNWIIRHVLTIPESYDEDVKEYVKGLLGGARERMKQDMKAVIDRWTEYFERAGEEAEKESEESSEKKEEEEGEELKPEDEAQPEPEKGEEGNPEVEKEKSKKKKQEPSTQETAVPEYPTVVRAKTLYEIITGESITVPGLDLGL